MTEITSQLSSALADRYRLERHLGEGGMATVYLAHDLKHDRKVAVKVLKPELSAIIGGERFLNEIKVTANLQHPNILPLYDSGEADTFLYYVMPYIEGETLRDKMDRDKQLGLEETMEIAKALSSALDYAHEQGIVHRDIKPENILMQRGQPLVADFGIALAVSHAGGTRLTETGLSLGTPHYMSPEQATGDRELDARSDVYSLGAMVYEMLAGEPPHVGNSVQAIVAKILTDTPASVTRSRGLVPPNVDAALQRALAKSPADRFSRAGDFSAALTNPAYTLPTTAAVPAAEGAPQGKAQWNRVTMALAGLSLVLIALLVWMATRPEAPRPVSRYSVALPTGEGIVPTRSNRVAIAPDGSRFVYVGVGDGGKSLWVRSRNQLQATPLPGTASGVHPFFSPDGSRVGFLTDGSPIAVKAVSLAGGPPITVVDSGVGLDGAAWGPDGFIYFDGITAGSTIGIMRVRAAGGSPEQATVVDTAHGETDHVWPEALPNGKGLLFSVFRGANLVDADIAVTEIGTGEHTVLVRGVAAKYAASGHLLYVTSDGALLAAPFDQGRMELTGEATALVQDIGIRAFGSIDISLANDGTLLYGTGAQATDPDEIVWVTRDGVAEVIDPGWVGDFGTVALSPDERQLAVSIVQGNEQHVWVKQLPTGPLTKLTFGGTLNYRPAWSPDGRSVVFVSDRMRNMTLHKKRADGSAQAEPVLEHALPIWDFSESRDGEWLVFRTTPRDLLALSPDGDTLTLVSSEFNERTPKLSPDGRWLAYSSDESGRQEIYVRPFPNTGDAKWQVSTSGGYWPAWSHSGRELFYRTAQREMISVDVVPGPTFAMGERRVLFTGAYRIGPGSYDITSDDQRFVMLRNRGTGQASELIVVENFIEELKERVGN
jgi:serine/threonine-protein kinase